MMCQNFESIPVPYRTTDELSPTFFPDLRYHPEIPAPYAEKLNRITGLWVDGDMVAMSCWMNMIYWPGWEILRWEFNANTGDGSGVGDFVGGFLAQDVGQGAGGELYIKYITGNIYPLGPAPDYEELTDEVIEPSLYGYVGFNTYLFDKMRNRAILHPSGSALRALQVFEKTSGTWLHDIPLPENPIQICYDSGSRVYVLMENKGIVCVDYETGQYFSYIRLPQIGSPSDTRIAWHQAYRRLLVVEMTPDNPDGTSTTTIHGYRYYSVPFHVCKPIPLVSPRKGEITRVLVKQIGDLGEGVAGMATLSVDPDEIQLTLGTNVSLDGDGEGRAEVRGLIEGASTLTANSEVACQL